MNGVTIKNERDVNRIIIPAVTTVGRERVNPLALVKNEKTAPMSVIKR
jgi:hypothetical protein